MTEDIGPVFLVMVDPRDNTLHYQVWDSELAYDNGQEAKRYKVMRDLGGVFSCMLADYARTLPMFEGVQPDG